jgi:hypothetical protein
VAEVVRKGREGGASGRWGERAAVETSGSGGAGGEDDARRRRGPCP